MPRLLISCGEASGDLYGAELVRELRKRVRDVDVLGLGGDRLQAEGASLLAHAKDLAVVGLLEVLSHLRDLRAVFRRVVQEVDRRPPDAAVLVDYPDFNLRLARSYRLNHDWIVSRGIHGSHDVTGRGRETSQVATAGHAANKDVGVAGQFHHANAITEDGAAGKRAGRVNGNYTDLAVATPQLTYEMRDQSAFAGARSTRHSYDVGMAGVLMQLCQVTAGCRYFVLNQGYHTCQGTAVTA